MGSRRTTPTAPVAAAVVSEPIVAPRNTPCAQLKDSRTSGTVPARRPPKMMAEMGTPCGSLAFGESAGLFCIGAVKRLFGSHAYELSMSSTKSAIGHLLGAAGSVEAIFSILAIRYGVVPPTLNLDNPSPSCDIDLVPKRAKERNVNYALSNSFGFGGTNASLIFVGPP